MNELHELQNFIRDGRKAINRIESWLIENDKKYAVIIEINLNDIQDMFKHMKGWVDCLEYQKTKR